LVSNHWKEFSKLNPLEFENVCNTFNCNPNDSLNINKFYTLQIIHKLFTSKSAKNGSRGEILNIPYFWHWVTPNPRYEIVLTKNKQLLKDIPPTHEFLKYNSFADIDRTPYLFLSELLLEKPKYYTTTCGEFSTFGWCSEREMAFVCLMETIGYTGKVMTNGNHSWSEFIISLSSNDTKNQTIRVKVDNTFDGLEFEKIKENDTILWKQNTGNSPQTNWYNQKAHSSSQKLQLKNHMVSKEAICRIEESITKYLSKKTNSK
jgi:hypothetical protein